MSKKKIVNDPVYGFINIPAGLIFDVIEHPFFQRLRRIKQLGLTDFVYPGALHTRFHHALGAMHLMSTAMETLKSKGHAISKSEYEAVMLAILLHDVGHGPFSHALETTLLKDVSHEHLSLKIMQLLNQKFKGRLDLTIQIFKGKYRRKFFHQLVASQLDIDRLDYLNRDSFFTGVLEGTIGAERIIKMLTIKNDQIVVEEKGIYSIENFLSARRLMYWQVYLHKTTVSAEKMIIQLVSRAKELLQKDIDIFCGPELRLFLQNDITLKDFDRQPDLLEAYASLDDFDIWGAIKIWQTHKDPILSGISKMLLTRDLFQIRMSNKPATRQEIQQLGDSIQKKFKLERKDALCLLDHGTLSNAAYISIGPGINILHKSGKVEDIAQASDLPNIKAMSKIVKKYYLCWPKSVNL